MPGYFAEQVQNRRLDAGLTQRELAERCGTHQCHISRLEAGEQAIGESMLEKIAEALGLSMAELVEKK